jgi:hypothetical protein
MNLKPLGSNQTELDLGNGTIVLFSYKTPVAVMIDEGLGFVFYRTDKKWSVTTSRHINKWLGVYGKVASEKPQEYFDILISEGK